MPQQKLYRDILDVLLAEYDSSTPPGRTSGYPEHLLACVWGLYCQIHRHARAAVLLSDNGMGHEAGIIARIMMEHTVVMHWIVEQGDDGVDALLANQSKRMKKWVDRTTKESSLAVPPEIASELMDGFDGIDEEKALKQFDRICREVGVEDLYSAYGFLSNFVHPTTTTSNIYCDPSHNLRLAPPPELGENNISLITHCLIWAERDFDRLTPGHPKADGLEKLASSVKAVPVLPPYRTLPPPPSQPRRRKRGRTKK